MRRYIISHFREPIDIASSSLSEKHAIFGGGPNLKLGLKNVITKYDCRLVGVATTCLTETIGDDTPRFLHEFRREFKDLLDSHDSPELVSVSTPSYSGTHMEGFHEALRATVEQITKSGPPHSRINIMPGLVSPADIRYIKEIVRDFGISATIFPDISTTLDAVAADTYEKLASGGVPLSEIRAMGASPASLEFGRTLDKARTAGGLLENDYNIPCHSLGMPIGLRETDSFFETLSHVSHASIPENHEMERGRLIDAYVDAHKYLFGARAVVYGEEDLVVGLTSFLAEIGVKPVLCASGGESGRLKEAVESVTADLLSEPPVVMEGMDFYEIAEIAEHLQPEILIGNSKGYHLARRWGVPLVRVGFPIHDRLGGPRILHLGYRGAQSLLDSIANAIIETRQEESGIGYTYY